MENPYASPSSNLEGQNTNDPLSTLSEPTAQIVRETRPWVRIAALCFSVNLLVQILTVAQSPGGFRPPMFLGFLITGYLAAKLWQFGTWSGIFSKSRLSVDLQFALAQQRKFWRCSSVLLLLLFIAFAVMIVGFVAYVQSGR